MQQSTGNSAQNKANSDIHRYTNAKADNNEYLRLKNTKVPVSLSLSLGPDHKKLTFFLAALYRSKLWINGKAYIYIYTRFVVKYGVTKPSQKKVIRVQS
jgi:hypothetical protein